MADVLFITEDYLKSMSTINENVDFKILMPTIIMVQDIYLQKILGTPLYKDLKTKVSANPSLSSYPNEKDLIDNYISKTLIWYIKMESAMEFKFHSMNKGIQVKSSDNSQSADTTDIKYLMNEWRIKAERYSQLLTNHLLLNTATFPKYLTIELDGMQPALKDFTNGIYMNNYGKDNKLQKGANGADYYF
jgi:hypothetical protein